MNDVIINQATYFYTIHSCLNIWDIQKDGYKPYFVILNPSSFLVAHVVWAESIENVYEQLYAYDSPLLDTCRIKEDDYALHSTPNDSPGTPYEDMVGGCTWQDNVTLLGPENDPFDFSKVTVLLNPDGNSISFRDVTPKALLAFLENQ